MVTACWPATDERESHSTMMARADSPAGVTGLWRLTFGGLPLVCLSSFFPATFVCRHLQASRCQHSHPRDSAAGTRASIYAPAPIGGEGRWVQSPAGAVGTR